MTNFLLNFYNSHGVTSFHLLIIVPIVAVVLLPAIFSTILMSIPVITLIFLINKPLLVDIVNGVKDKIKAATNYDSIRRRWGFAVLNNSGILTDYEQSTMSIYEQQLYYKIFTDFIGENSALCIFKNSEPLTIQDYFQKKFGVNSQICEDIQHFEIPQGARKMTILYELGQEKESVEFFSTLCRQIEFRFKKENLDSVNIVTCGVLKNTHTAFIEKKLLSSMLLSQKKDWSISVSHAINLGIKEKQRLLQKKILKPYSIFLSNLIGFFDQRIIKKFKDQKLKYMIYKYDFNFD